MIVAPYISGAGCEFAQLCTLVDGSECRQMMSGLYYTDITNESYIRRIILGQPYLGGLNTWRPSYMDQLKYMNVSSNI